MISVRVLWYQIKNKPGLGEEETVFKRIIARGTTRTIAMGEEGNYNRESGLNAASVSKVKQKRAFLL